MTVCGWKLLPWLSCYFSVLVVLASPTTFLLILLHGFLSYKILFFYMIPSHIITSYISFPYSQICLHSQISSGIKTPSFHCLFSGFYHHLMGLSISSFVKVNSLSYHFSFLLLPTLHSSECTSITCSSYYYVITISVFIDHLCCTSIVVNVYNVIFPTTLKSWYYYYLHFIDGKIKFALGFNTFKIIS